MTNTWQDIKNANVVLVMGGNAAEAHPCGFKWVTEAKQHNHARLVVVDPRFTRTASVADLYAPIRPGTDIAFLNGVMRYLLEKDAIQREYVLAFTNASLIVKEGFGFQDGLFSGFSPEKKRLRPDELGLRDRRGRLRQERPHAADPRCVINLLKQHVERYTPEMVSRICGTPVEKFLRGLRADRLDVGARQGADLDVRAGLDAAFGGQPEHPRHGDGAAAARQYRRGRRRDERAARAFQHPGPHRHRACCPT